MLPAMRHFAPAEFHHPDLVDADAARYLDAVRDRYGQPLFITDDARLPTEAPSGSVASSLHYLGRAFDLHWISPGSRLARFMESVVAVAGEWGVDYELGFVNSLKDRHVHLGLQKPGIPSEVYVAAD